MKQFKQVAAGHKEALAQLGPFGSIYSYRAKKGFGCLQIRDAYPKYDALFVAGQNTSQNLD